MEFFGFTSSDLSTPIGALIKSATDPLLLGPDWQKNMEVCDMVTATRDGPDQAVKALIKRFQDNDNKVVALALTVAETCMKNCGIGFAATVSVVYMEEIKNISKGRKGLDNQDKALKLIQQWGREFEKKKSRVPIFYDTWMGMTTRGIRFPPEEAITPSFDVTNIQSRGQGGASRVGKPEASLNNAEKLSSMGKETRRETEPVDEFSKLNNDLDVVVEKIKLCREMLPESPGIQQDDALAEVIGFLEACRDRMTGNARKI